MQYAARLRAPAPSPRYASAVVDSFCHVVADNWAMSRTLGPDPSCWVVVATQEIRSGQPPRWRLGILTADGFGIDSRDLKRWTNHLFPERGGNGSFPLVFSLSFPTLSPRCSARHRSYTSQLSWPYCVRTALPGRHAARPAGRCAKSGSLSTTNGAAARARFHGTGAMRSGQISIETCNRTDAGPRWEKGMA